MLREQCAAAATLMIALSDGASRSAAPRRRMRAMTAPLLTTKLQRPECRAQCRSACCSPKCVRCRTALDSGLLAGPVRDTSSALACCELRDERSEVGDLL